MKRFCILALLCAAAARGVAAGNPRSPEDEARTFHLADARLAVELAVAEPEVRAPVALAWDADGRMFVAEMTDYPSGPVSGRIRLLEDRDGDGRYERATIFATNLAFPNGVMPWKNGLLVTAAPDIWFLADTNGDGVADVREKILTGFAEGNQQLRVNGLYWGIDNWIYGCNGRSDGEVKWADGTPAGSIRRHDFRFRPDTKQFELIAGNSQFGMGHDDWGNRFPVFNNTPIRHVAIEDRYLARQPALAGIDNVPNISPANDGNRVFALTPPNLLIPQPIGFFTSACGPSVYRGPALPAEYYGNYFVCEPVQNVVQRRVLKPSGSTFMAKYAHTNVEFLAAADPWFHGVFTATGPDGALYVVDFYRDLVEHPHWVAPELRDKIDWRRGGEHGRIWRVRARNTKPAKVEKLSRASNSQLVQALESDNGWTRDTAQRLLVERKASGEQPTIEKLARSAAKPQTRVQAMSLLSEFGGGSAALYSAGLRDRHAEVRQHSIRLLGQTTRRGEKKESTLRELARLSDDVDARVRMELACALGEFPNDAAQLSILARVAQHRDLDFWQALAILSSAGHRPWLLGEKLTPMLERATDNQLRLLERLAGIVAAGTSRPDATAMFAWLRGSRSVNRFLLWASALEALRAKQRTDAGEVPFAAAIEAARNRGLADPVRVAAIRVAARQDSGDYLNELASLITSAQPEPVQIAAAKVLLERNEANAAQLAFARWADCSKDCRRQIVAASARRSRAALALLKAAEQGLVPLMEIDPATRQAIEKSGEAEVKSRATKLFAASISPDREAVVQRFRPALKLAGDRRHGAELFERTCTVCHQMQGVGAKVGPDLSGIGQQPRETLLVQILDPSRQVLPDFVAYTAETKGGETVTGFIASESPSTVTLRRANEPDITLPRADLKELKTSGKSLMPDGLEAGMSEQDVADLIEFLRRPDRTLFAQTK